MTQVLLKLVSNDLTNQNLYYNKKQSQAQINSNKPNLVILRVIC